MILTGRNRILKHLYEDRVSGFLSDERFRKMQVQYETEQRKLLKELDELSSEIGKLIKKHYDTDYIFALTKEYPVITELTPEIVRKFIEKVVVSEPELIEGKWKQRVRVYYNNIGEILLPGQRTVFVTSPRHRRERVGMSIDEELALACKEDEENETFQIPDNPTNTPQNQRTRDKINELP